MLGIQFACAGTDNKSVDLAYLVQEVNGQRVDSALNQKASKKFG